MRLHLFGLFFLWIIVAGASSPSGGYAPGLVQCPAKGSLLREAKSVSENEKDWVKQRQKKTQVAFKQFIKNANLRSFDVDKFFNGTKKPSNIALAFSGGGYRAMYSAAGHILAFDNRTSMTNEGDLQGILQSSTYVAALSGGSYLLGSLAMQNWPSVQDVVFEDPNDLWNLTITRTLIDVKGLWTGIFPLITNNLNGLLNHLNFWNGRNGIKADLKAKQNAGFSTSITDAWSRGLAHQLFPKKDNYYDSATWSDIRNMSSFKDQDMPFPLLQTVARKPGSLEYNKKSLVLEINPYEMGSYDPHLGSFTDLKYLGTEVNSGRPVNRSHCIEGFDNAAFIIGTSSNLFNQFLSSLVDGQGISKFILILIRRIVVGLSRKYQDIALYQPNPFYKSNYTRSTNISNSDTLYLIDGGLGGETIPLPLLSIKQRALDAIIAFEETSETSNGWPNGSSLVTTYEKQFTENGKSTVFPYVPGVQTFLDHNLTAKPTFFGCDASNLTDLKKDGVVPPVVLFFANRPYEFYSNTSTYKLTYSDAERKALIKNGYDVATRLNGTLDDEFSACVACALVRREEERRDIKQTTQCKRCFKRYCWDGSTKSLPNKFSSDQNFTANGLTNDTNVFYGSQGVSAALGGILKRNSLSSDAANKQFPGWKYLLFATLSLIM